MNRPLKKNIAVVASIVLLLVAWYGSFLPFRKSQKFIFAIQQASGAKTLEELQNMLSVPLTYFSPIGQEELVRNMGNMVANILQNTNDKATIETLMEYFDSYYKPIIDRGRGMSYSQNLYLLGSINETAYLKTGNIKYLDAAERYFVAGNELGPNRPQFLYGLFDVYRIRGDAAKTIAIGERILSLWENDKRVKELLGEFLKQTTKK